MEMLFHPFETYYSYHCLKNHLTTSSFDFHTAIDHEGMRRKFLSHWNEKANQHHLFMGYTRKFRRMEDMRDHFLSVLVTRSTKTSRDELYDLDVYRSWVGRLHAMHVHFDDDLTRLRRKAGSLPKAIRPATGQPALYTMLMSGNVSMETFAWLVYFQPKVFDIMNSFFDPLDTAWKERSMVARKYPAFLTKINIDQERLKSILKGYLK